MAAEVPMLVGAWSRQQQDAYCLAEKGESGKGQTGWGRNGRRIDWSQERVGW